MHASGGLHLFAGKGLEAEREGRAHQAEGAAPTVRQPVSASEGPVPRAGEEVHRLLMQNFYDHHLWASDLSTAERLDKVVTQVYG